MLVGDILLSAREAVPDLPGALPAPAPTDLTISFTTGGVLVPGATYYLVATYSTLWGESSPGLEVIVTMPAGMTAILVNPAPSPYRQLVTAINIYLGTVSGGEVFRYAFPNPVNEQLFVNGVAANYSLSVPPAGNSAYLLDSGGNVAGAQQLFRWLSDALNAVANANGGIPDASGFPTITGRNNYTLPGDWKSLEAAWYDGYPLFLGSAKNVFRHNSLNGLAGQMSYVQVADTLVIELYAQPNRTAGQTTLSAPLALTDVGAAFTQDLSGFVLPFGLASIGTEIVSYVSSGSLLTQLVRGLGGTSAQAWPVGTAVHELNCMFTGFRSPQTYVVGQAANTLRIPSDWTPYIHLYLLARYREIEQQRSEASQLFKEFDAYLKSASKRKPVVGERQIQPQDSIGMEVFNGLSRTFGGIVIP